MRDVGGPPDQTFFSLPPGQGLAGKQTKGNPKKNGEGNGRGDGGGGRSKFNLGGGMVGQGKKSGGAVTGTEKPFGGALGSFGTNRSQGFFFAGGGVAWDI